MKPLNTGRLVIAIGAVALALLIPASLAYARDGQDHWFERQLAVSDGSTDVYWDLTDSAPAGARGRPGRADDEVAESRTQACFLIELKKTDGTLPSAEERAQCESRLKKERSASRDAR